MGETGWVRDRAQRGREAAMGATILSDRSAAKGRQNGGAPSSLTQPQSPHHTWPICERDLFQR